jgi:DNA-binding transcriptional MerR regulator
MPEEKSMDELYMQIRAFQKTINPDQIKPRLKSMGFSVKQIEKAFNTLESKSKVKHKKNTILEEIEKYQSGSTESSNLKKKEKINPNIKIIESRYQKLQQSIYKLSRKGHDTSILNMKLLHSYTDLIYLKTDYEEKIFKNMDSKLLSIESEINNYYKEVQVNVQ